MTYISILATLGAFLLGNFVQSASARTFGLGPYQPNIVHGGRLMALAVDPRDSSSLIAAAESGGLFRTADGGAHWSHIDSLAQFRIMDVKIDPHYPIDRLHIFATSRGDTHSEPQAGIWRSVDGGVTWKRRPIGGLPVTCARPEGAGVSFSPDDASVYVGTTCGLAISRDSGRTWRHVDPNPNSPPGSKTVVSVVAHGRGLVDIYGVNGFQRSERRGRPGTFGSPNNQVPPSNDISVQALAVSPFDDEVLFVASHPNQLESDDGGRNWTPLTTPVRTGRPPVVATFPQGNGLYAVYFGGVNIARQFCAPRSRQPNCSNALNSWQTVNTDHVDINGIIGAAGQPCPILLATDGGAHRTEDCGINFKRTGGGDGGLNALQIYEVNGQVHPDHTDLYFGTQDNSLWASPDDGLTWPNHVDPEGFFLQMAHATATHDGQTITGAKDFRSGNFQSDAHFEHASGWIDPPGAVAGQAPIFVSAGVYVEWAKLPNGSFQLFRTETGGPSWKAIPGTLINAPPFGIPLVAGPPENPTLYQVYSRANGSNGLIRVTGIRSKIANLLPADAQIVDLRFFSGGIATFVTKAPVGIDPNDPNHLIVADVGAKAMKVSRDGGGTWTVDAALTSAVTANGTLVMFEPSTVRGNEIVPGGQVQSLAFHPTNSNLILVGTEAAGIIGSDDGGQTWMQVPGSDQIPAINAFFFDEIRGSVTISSYGRGLWRMGISGSLVAQAHPGGAASNRPAREATPKPLNANQLMPAAGNGSPRTISKTTGNYDPLSFESCTNYCSNSGYKDHACLRLDHATSSQRTLTGWYCCRETALPDRSIPSQETVQRTSGLLASCILPQGR